MSLLPGYCSIDGCERPRLSGLEVCYSHNKLENDKGKLQIEKPVKPLQRGGPPKRVSDKRQEQNDVYFKMVEEWRVGKICVMCDWGGKKNTNITPHHQEGREGERLKDFTKIIPLCIKHHNWATEHSKEAIELGISLPRNHLKKGNELY